MTVDGREDLFHYSYLNANKYLDKFRNALNLPALTLSLLAALLNEYKNRTRMAGFIVANRKGKKCLYNKEILNKILGMSNDGHFYMKPEQNPNLQMLHRFIDEWDMKEFDKEQKPAQYSISTYQNDDEDMKKVSDKLIHDDNYLEEFDVKKSLKNLENRRDPDGIEKKKKSGKKIFITESQFNDLKKRLSESYFVEPEKVNIVKKFLDDNFVRGTIPTIGEDGYGKAVCIVGMKIPCSDQLKNMTAKQAFYLLQDKFNHIYSEPKQRDKFLKNVLIDWYNDNISKNGLLSRNNY